MEEEHRRRARIGLALLGLPLAVAALLTAWSITASDAPRDTSAVLGKHGASTRVADRLGTDVQALALGRP